MQVHRYTLSFAILVQQFHKGTGDLPLGINQNSQKRNQRVPTYDG